MNGGLITLNLPSQVKNLRSRDRARAGSWKPNSYMSDHSVWSRAILRWILHLLFNSYECWTSSRNCWGRRTLGRRNGHAERTEVNMFHDRSLSGLCQRMLWVRGRTPAAPRGRWHVISHLHGCISPHIDHPLTPSKHHPVKPEVLIHVASHYSEIMTFSGWVVKPGCLQKSCGRSLRNHSHHLPNSRQESQLDRGYMSAQEPELVCVMVGWPPTRCQHSAQRFSLRVGKEPAA